MTDDVNEFDMGAVPDAQKIAALKPTAERALQLMGEIESAEEYLGTLKTELHILNTRTLPEMLTSAGVEEFKTAEGAKIAIKEFMNGSLPKDAEAREKALKWIESVGAGGLIKNAINIQFEKGQDNVAKSVLAMLDEHGLEYEKKRDVHAMTLAAFARERLKNGEEVPLEDLGLVAGRTTKITLPKAKKSKDK